MTSQRPAATDARAVLQRLLAGEAASAAQLANDLRVEAFGCTTFGRTDALDLFAAHPLVLSSEAQVLTSTRSLAILDGVADARATGVFADLVDGVICRVWVVSTTAADAAAEAAVPVARDDFMSQIREQGQGDPADHPELRAGAWHHVQALGGDALQAVQLPTAASSSQFWVLRAFSSGDSVAALVRLRVLTRTPARRAHDRLALGMAQGAGHTECLNPGAGRRHRLALSDALPVPPPAVF